MIDSDYPRFVDILGTVAVAMNRDLDTATSDIFFKALKEVPWELIRRVAAEVIKNEERWPTPAKWRKLADEVQDHLSDDEKRRVAGAQQKLLAAPTVFDEASQTYVPTIFCPYCNDTGWKMECGCPATDRVTMFDSADLKGLGHCKGHGGHSANGILYPQLVKPCDCRDSNPAYLATHPATVQRFSREARRKEGSYAP